MPGESPPLVMTAMRFLAGETPFSKGAMTELKPRSSKLRKKVKR
jgi:hypothetical protein